MPLREPHWWYGHDRRGTARLLQPLAHVYGRVAANRLRYARPYTSRIPVVCIGNFTAGGTGKTPLAIMLAEHLRGRGERPALLTRGYGGRLAGPHLVDPQLDRAERTGDEALLLARVAPTLIARDRAAGARWLEARADSPSAIIMDDGLQNPGLAKMLRIGVVDARRGIGNGRVIPAGPLRAPLAAQVAIVDAIILNAGPTPADVVPAASNNLIALFRSAGFAGPILTGGIVPRSEVEVLRGRPVVAFAGIGFPERFFDTLHQAGIETVETVALQGSPISSMPAMPNAC